MHVARMHLCASPRGFVRCADIRSSPSPQGNESDSDGEEKGGRRRRGRQGQQAEEATPEVLSLTHHTGQAARLAADLNAEKDIPAEFTGWLEPLTHADGSALYISAEAARQQLAVCWAFLWSVHGVDYFAGYERTLVEMAVAAAGGPDAEGQKREQAPPPKDEEFGVGLPWEAEVDRAWQARARDGDPATQQLGVGSVDRAIKAFLESSVKPLGEAKFGCGLCDKMFQTVGFVEKHLHNKHKEVVDDIRVSALEGQYEEIGRAHV